MNVSDLNMERKPLAKPVAPAAILFFMGGLAPTGARRRLSKRERDLLDN